MKNKKKIIMVAVAAALLIGVSGVGIAAALNTGSEPVKTAQNSQKAKTTDLNKKKDVKTDAKAKLTKTASETKTPTPEKSNGNKKRDQVTQPAHQEQTKQNNANSGNTGNHVQKPSPTDPEPQRPADPEPQPQHTAAPESTPAPAPTPAPEPVPAPIPAPQPEPAPPAHVCSFDIPITQEEPEMQQVLVWYCNTCGADITEDPIAHQEENLHGGYHDAYELRPTGNTILTTIGYKCSCGAVQAQEK